MRKTPIARQSPSVRIRNGTAIDDQDDEAAHRRRAGLRVVALRPLLADVLAELALAHEVDEARREEDAQQQRRRPADQDLAH